MPRGSRVLSESGVYHVMMRGVNRDVLFLDPEDCQRFLLALAKTKEASGCSVLAYCLMGNHVHLLLRTDREPLGVVIKRLGVRYARWFNDKYERVGHVFQGRFRSKPVETDAYLLTVVRYIWGNPVEAGFVDDPKDFRWNSCWRAGAPAGLVDDEELDALLPRLARVELAAPVQLHPFGRPRSAGRPPRHNIAEVAELVRSSCGAENAAGFGRLPADIQRCTIRELRTRSVSYEQIAAVTGLSASSVRRLHLSGP